MFTKVLLESGIAIGRNFWYYTQRLAGPIQGDIIATPDRLSEAMRIFWGQFDKFTDPQKLDGSPFFRIIIHSITGIGWSEGGPTPGSWNEKLLADPELIANNPKISASKSTAAFSRA